MYSIHITPEHLNEIHKRCKGVFPSKSLSYEEWCRCILASEKDSQERTLQRVADILNFAHLVGDTSIVDGMPNEKGLRKLLYEMDGKKGTFIVESGILMFREFPKIKIEDCEARLSGED